MTFHNVASCCSAIRKEKKTKHKEKKKKSPKNFPLAKRRN